MRPRPRWSAASRCGPRGSSKESRVQNGPPLELAVDTRYLQFFDPASGLSIGHPLAAAGLAEH